MRRFHVSIQTCLRNPRLLSGLGDDLRASLVSTLDHFTDGRIVPCTQAEDTFTVSARCDLVVADDSAETVVRDEHDANSIVEGELQRFRDAIRRWLADEVEIEPIAVEGGTNKQINKQINKWIHAAVDGLTITSDLRTPTSVSGGPRGAVGVEWRW